MTAQYDYTYLQSQSSTAMSVWSFVSYQLCHTSVLPDGCRDLIVEDNLHTNSTWFVSDLSHSAYSVCTAADVHMRGVRLNPGVTILESQLCSWLSDRDAAEIFVSDNLDEFCKTSDNLSTALQCLASGERTALSAAKTLGVSLRTLERLVKSNTGEPPYFWLSLARARKAARSLTHISNLSDAACAAGFADQSHMSREMKKWFGQTPLQIKENDTMQSILAEPGYG